MIALLCSVQAETDRILTSIDVLKSTTLGSKLLIEGTIGAQRILLCISGMGKVNAAHTATLMLARFNPKAIVVFGIGGAWIVTPALNIFGFPMPYGIGTGLAHMGGKSIVATGSDPRT